jgi:colanic acid biosynthesis glycosyl transferase WcaI
VLTQYYLPQPLANAEVIGALASGWGRLGLDVVVVAPVQGMPATPGVTPISAPGWFARDRSSVWRRVVEYASFSLGGGLKSLWIARRQRVDIVFVPSPPPTLALVGLLVARMTGARFVYNVQDVYPQVAAAVARQPKGVLAVLLRVVRLVYRAADLVVVIDGLFIPLVTELASTAHVAAVRNGIDLLPFSGDDDLRSNLGIPLDATVVMYAGNIGRSQDLLPMIRAALDHGAWFVVHGGGAATTQLVADVARLEGADHVRFSTYGDRSRLGAVYRTGNLHVVPLRPEVARSSVPSKLLSIAAAGRPVLLLAERGTPAAMIVEDESLGWRVDPGEPGALSDALRDALGDVTRLHERGETARRWADRAAGAEAMASAYISLFQALPKRRRR